ncbi:putative reverse transcriptase domain-containing protein [Tanacetum coccineum]
MTWGWRKFLQLRLLIRDHVRYHLGDGATCSLWFYRWSPCGLLADIISSRDIHRAGFNISSKVQVAVANGAWIWPSDWYSKYPILNSLATPNLSDVDDRLEWRERVGVVKLFSVAAVWNCVRPRSDVVNWCDVVWLSNCIPRHAFHMWLVAKRRLKTQDLLRQWDINRTNQIFQCSLCDGQPDSHEHLFFECVFSKQVWDSLKELAGLSNVEDLITVIVDSIIPFAK